MGKNSHNIDQLFKNAQKQSEELAPANAWEKIQAGLDKQDADKYKRWFIGWKRTALLLLLLLAGFVIYETGGIKTGKGETDKQANLNTGPDNNFSSNSVRDSFNAENKTDEIIDKAVTSSTDLNTTMRDYLKKDSFSPYTIYTDSDRVNTTGNYISIDNKITKNGMKLSVAIADDQTYNMEFNKMPKIFNTSNGNQQVCVDEDGLAGVDLDRQIFAEEIKVSRIESKIISVPNTTSKPLHPLITLNTLTNSSAKQNGKFKPYWSTGAFISSDWAMYHLDDDVPDNGGTSEHEKDKVSKRERHEGSYSTGITVTRQFSKHIGVKTGVIFSNTAIVISPEEIYAVQQNGEIAYKYITSSGYGLIKPGFGLPLTIGESINSAEAQHNLQVFSIPLSLSYGIDKKRFSLIASAGLSANFISSAKVETEVSEALNKEEVSITDLYGMRHFYNGFVADINVQYKIIGQLSVNILPSFKYALSPITKNNVVKTFPYSIGLGAGLTFKF